MLEAWFVLLTIALIGDLIYGTIFLVTSWQWLRDGTINVVSDIVANQYFRRFLGALIVIVTLPLGAGILVFTLADFMSPDFARFIVFVCYVFPALVLLAIGAVADLFANVIVKLTLVAQPFDKVRTGIRYSVFGYLMWELFIGELLFVFGPYAPLKATLGLVIGGLLYVSVSIYYNKPVRWFPKAAATMGLAMIVWFPLASIPTSFWMTMVGRDLRPKINLASPIDNQRAHRAQAAREAALGTRCDAEFDRIIKELKEAKRSKDWGAVSTLSTALDTNNKNCTDPLDP